MTEKWTIKFVKDRVREMGLREKMEFFHWLMQNLLKELYEDVEGETKHDTTT